MIWRTVAEFMCRPSKTPTSLSTRLDCPFPPVWSSKMKVEEAQWTVRKTETAISVSLFWPSFSANRGVNSSMASMGKRHHQCRQRKKSGKHITNLGPTVSNSTAVQQVTSSLSSDVSSVGSLLSL